MPPDTPLNKAHKHAINAEDYISRGLLIPAVEEHYRSAEAFLQCMNEASDDGIKRTLRMLYTEHNKAGKELQRKIVKLKEEGKDPNLPQPLPPLVRKPVSLNTKQTDSSMPAVPNLTQSTMAESNYPIGESYMMLGQQVEPQDAFAQFWDILEGMLDNLSQPVAFATAPLARSVVSESKHIHNGEKVVSSTGQLKLANHANSDNEADFCDLEEVLADESLSDESFFIVPSVTTSSDAKLLKENEALNAQIIILQQKLQLSEQLRNEQEEKLRERIEIARREAQRVRYSGYLPSRVASVDLNAPSVPVFSTVNTTRENSLSRRIKELEEESRLLKIENDKQQQMISKFRERWEKLKESARRKKLAKVTAVMKEMREQCIEEDPEAEAAATESTVV